MALSQDFLLRRLQTRLRTMLGDTEVPYLWSDDEILVCLETSMAFAVMADIPLEPFERGDPSPWEEVVVHQAAIQANDAAESEGSDVPPECRDIQESALALVDFWVDWVTDSDTGS